MSRGLRAALVWPALVLLPQLACAQTTANPKPIRHLSFDISYVAVTRIEEASTGANPGIDPGAHDSINTAANASARLEVDVIAATQDRGLVVDAQEIGPVRKSSKTRFGITSDGKLLYDPNANVLEEEVRMLPLLSQGRFDQATGAGDMWRVPFADPSANGEEVVRIFKADGDRISAEVTGTLEIKGPNARTETTRLRTDYNLHLVTPLVADLDVHSRRTRLGGEAMIVDTSIHLQLLSDTFAAK